MKKIISIFIIVAFVFNTLNAQIKEQTTDQKSFNSTQLFKKARQQKLGAWILAGVGILSYATVVFINLNPNGSYQSSSTYGGWNNLTNTYNTITTYPDKFDKGNVIKYGGIACVLGSVPLFIAAAKNKRHAGLLLQKEEISFNHIFKNKSFPALAIKFNM